MDTAATERTARADVGFAAGARGGVAYAAVVRPGAKPVSVRAVFRCAPLAALDGRDVAYAAAAAICEALLRRGLRRVELGTSDARLVADLEQRRDVPAPLLVPHVALRCKLNRFRAATVVAGDASAIAGLAALARAEVTLDAAA